MKDQKKTNVMFFGFFGPQKSTKLIRVDIVCVQLEFCHLSCEYQNVNLHLQGLSFLKTKDGDS